MSQPVQEAGAASRTLTPARLLAWLIVPLLAVLAAGWLTPSTVQAGTITIVDGLPTTQPVGGVYADGYIQNYLTITGSLTISTTGVGTGLNEIRVLQSAVITWTTGNTLTLDAGTNVVISGTIQHDGPDTGAGGLRLLASGTPTGAVIVGPGDQTSGVAAGSRFGLTRVQAGNLALTGGGDPEAYAQLGYHVVDQGALYSVAGPISVTVGQNIMATGGITNYTFVQIGHGGADPVYDATPSGSFSGTVAVDAGGDVIFQGGDGYSAYAQMGNGGTYAAGSHGGGHRLSAGGDVTFHGGSGGIAYTQLGNGGADAYGSYSGDHRLTTGGDVTFDAGSGGNAYAQLGNGGYGALGDQRGGHSLAADGAVAFRADGSPGTYAQLGNGGRDATGGHSGDHRLDAGGPVVFQGGSAVHAYAQLGNGGPDAAGDHSGDHRLTAGGDVTFDAGSGDSAYAQFGNGGYGANGDHSGDLALTDTASLTVTAGSGEDAYAMLGHGSDMRIDTAHQGTGSRAGDILLRVGETAVFSGSQVGHLTASGALSVMQGNTFLGVGRNNPFASGTGELLVTGITTTSFTSAPSGELRFYLPRADSQQIPTNATFNGATFATDNTIPASQLAGFAFFGEGSYLPPYSFYLGGQPDVVVAKSATPAGPLEPGQTLTYTVSFSNTGTITATGVVIIDPLPSVLTSTLPSLIPDAGVVITETSGPPNLAWTVSDLGPGKGGQFVLAATLQNAALALGSPFTNTAAINATGDISLTNNTASVSREVMPAATLTVTTTVVGIPPDSVWQFSGSGDIGSFSLPAIGGTQVITGLIPTTYTITETVPSGYTVAVSCTTGARGTNSVQVTLDPGAAVGCTFTNTDQAWAWLPALFVSK